MFKNKKEEIIKSTKSGRLYIETKDFLLQDKVKDTIKALLESDLIKNIDKAQADRNKEKVHA